MDLFPKMTGAGGNAKGNPVADAPEPSIPMELVMGYFDGNTVTALWNYAQRYAMSDNNFETTFGGQTNGVIDLINRNSDEVGGGDGSIILIGEPDPENDVCSDPHRRPRVFGRKQHRQSTQRRACYLGMVFSRL